MRTTKIRILQNMHKGLALILCIATLLSVLTTPAWGQRMCCEGARWLKWKPKVKEAYVEGYVEAYIQAFTDGCVQGTKNWPEKTSFEDSPLRKCFAKNLDFSKGTHYLVSAVDDFYKRYPHDRDIYITEVLEQLGKGLSLEQIDEYPFWRHNQQGKNKKQ